MCSGGRPSLSPSTAPISRSGIATRSTGRRRIDSSPSSVNDPLWPTSRPGSRRMRVPALWTSIGASGARSPRSPQPCTRRRVVASSRRSTRAPSASTAARVASVSALAPKPADLGRAVGDRAQQQRAVGDRLVPGHRQLADEGGRGATSRRSAPVAALTSRPPAPARPARRSPARRAARRRPRRPRGRPRAAPPCRRARA